MSKQVQDRARSDTALRIILGRDGAQQLADIVVPRLLSPTIIRRRTASASAAAIASENFLHLGATRDRIKILSSQ